MRHIEMKYVRERKRRKEIYRKRSMSLKKASYELSKLCDIPVLMICYGEEGDVITWPENKQEIEEIAEKIGTCTYHVQQRNQYSFCNEEKMRKRVEETKIKLAEMGAENAGDIRVIRQSMDAKLKEVRERIEFLSQQNNKDSNTNIVQESSRIDNKDSNTNIVQESTTIEAETFATSENTEGSSKTQSFDLNQLAHDESQDGIEEDVNLKGKEEGEKVYTDSEPALENLNGEHDRTDSEEDGHENERMMHDFMTMQCHWHWMAMNYWLAQLSVNRNMGADYLSCPSGVTQNTMDFVPGPVNFEVQQQPTGLVGPQMVFGCDQSGVLLGSGNVVNESDGAQHPKHYTKDLRF